MHTRLCLSAMLSLAVVSLSTVDAHAQSLYLTRLAGKTTSETRMYLNVLGADQRPITGRTAADIDVLSDSQKLGPAAALTTFEKSNEPISLVLLSQASIALGGPAYAEIRKGFRAIAQVAAAHPGSQVSVLSYATTVNRLLERGSPAAVEGVLSKLVPDQTAVELHLLDALKAAIDLLSQPGTAAAKQIVLVSDGLDVSKERRQFYELGHRAQAAGVVITILGFNQFETAALRNLEDISKRCYGPTRRSSKLEVFAAQLAAVPDEIQQQYVLTVHPKLLADSKEHYLQAHMVLSGKDVYSNVIPLTADAGGDSAPSQSPSQGPSQTQSPGAAKPPAPTRSKTPLVLPPT